ncbi:hypothetical protein [Cellulomonas cellasea]|uniref:Core-binding (CB) domain-containing protein n=1 Tax=Cellulomonas cellasea TaxID=43670 RepID=A0A7W4UIC8_9CELL|nr:hypothetical protein [Cellulomonas cellasea]MBB2924093.1 hypothetical protein [Cellulomonas cellasea]
MIAALETWLQWCRTHHVDPLNDNVKSLERAVTDLRRAGVARQELLNVIDQVGCMGRLWLSSDWLRLRHGQASGDPNQGPP